MNPLEDASNGSAMLLMLVVGAFGAAVGAVAALVRWSFLEVFDPNTGAEIIEFPPPCPLCDRVGP